ncbi:MAG TPA: SRPBCC family protein [Bacteroidia bacterium]|jgi:uncharacterized protein YndB with AHSA1/START domain|nr:SRPBCC family protein [Bacteroidia bacterium]
MEKVKEPVRGTDGRTLSITRLINAPVELVFEAWTKPDHIKHWWGPNGFTNTISKMDVKQGGEWVFTMHGPDGTDYPNTNVFVELVKNEKIVLKHVGPPIFEMHTTFKAQGKRTLISITSIFEKAEQLQAAIEAVKADIGLKQNVDRMEQYMYKLSAEAKHFLTREFNAPMEVVYKAWTDPKQFAKWWGPKDTGLNITRFELVPEGVCIYSMKFPGGNDMWGKFTYKEIVAPERIAFTSAFCDKEGNILPAPFFPVWPLEILNIVEFAENNGKTIITMSGGPVNATAEEFEAYEENKPMIQGGFKGTFDQFDEFLAAIQK